MDKTQKDDLDSKNSNTPQDEKQGQSSQSQSSSGTDSEDNDMSNDGQTQSMNQDGNQNSSSQSQSSSGIDSEDNDINSDSQTQSMNQDGNQSSQSQSGSDTDSEDNDMSNDGQTQSINQDENQNSSSQNQSSSGTDSEDNDMSSDIQSINQDENQNSSSQSQSGLGTDSKDNDMSSDGQTQSMNQDGNRSSQSESDLDNGKKVNKKQLTKEELQKIREKLQEYKDKKRKIEKNKKYKVTKNKLHNEEKVNEEDLQDRNYELSDKTNQFLEDLKNLPSFDNREHGDGYSIDTDGYTEVPDSIIRTLITKFLNQRFCKKQTDLNIRSNSLEKSKGFHKWEVNDVIVHLKTHQITKVFDDKYGYQYAEGKNENVPLSFYFDMSGSMSSYTNQLAVIAIELLKKNVKVLVGFNEVIHVQIERLKKNISIEELVKILEAAGDYSYSPYSELPIVKDDPLAIYKNINERIDSYLISKKAEKCVVFSDFDPRDEVCNLSNKSQVYWFCFERNFDRYSLSKYNGFIYPVQNIYDIAEGLIKVSSKRFSTLCYSDNPQELRRVKR